MQQVTHIDGLSGAEEAGVLQDMRPKKYVYEVTDEEFHEIWYMTYKGLTPFDELLDKIYDVKKAHRAAQIENIFAL